MKKKQILSSIFLSAFCLCSQAGNLSVFEDLLYWHASQQTTSVWAYQFSLVDPNIFRFSPTQGTHFTEPNVSFGWSPGLRLGLQYTPEHCFDTSLYWTHFETKTNDSILAPQGQMLLPEFFNGFTSGYLYNAAQVYWHLNMNMIDAEIGHPFHPLDSLTLRPSVGIKGGTINQKIHSAWQMNFFNNQVYNATENLKNDFSGLGPSLGIDSLWDLYKGIGIRSDFKAALLWGHWKVTDTYHRPGSLFFIIPFPEATIRSNTNNSLGAFMASYFLGFEWTVPAKASITLKAGYEMQFWSNQLRLPVFQALPIHGDLTLQGGTCGIYINL